MEMTEEQKAQNCCYAECPRYGYCAARLFDTICYHEKVARGRALADAKARASKVPNGTREGAT